MDKNKRTFVHGFWEFDMYLSKNLYIQIHLILYLVGNHNINFVYYD